MKMEADYADAFGPVLRDAIIAEAPGVSRFRDEQELSGVALKDSIFYERSITGEGAHILIKSTARHARFVVHGTQPHDIRPVNASVLRWEGVDGVHFAMVVHHPGTQPNPFPKRGAANVREEMAAGIRAAVRNAVHMEA